MIYSDQPVPGARLEGTVTAPAPVSSPPASSTTLSPPQEALRRASDERYKRLNELTAEIQNYSREIEAANARLAAGREPLEGDRIGTYNGRARMSDAYWARQAQNEQAVADAQARLNRAVAERNAIR